MKVITFNLRCCDDPNGYSISERAPRLKTILDKYDADVMGFQEVSVDWQKIIPRDFSDKYDIFYKCRTKEGAPEALAVLWKRDKFDLIDQGCFWFSKTPWIESMGADALFHCNRICIWVLLRELESGKQFYYFNTHFGFGDEYQLESAELLKTTTDMIKSDNIIITGDFNLTPQTPAYELLSSYYTDVNKITANYSGTTYHEYGTLDAAEHIDYCFIGKGVTASEYILIDDKVDGMFPSDHYGLAFELGIL